MLLVEEYLTCLKCGITSGKNATTHADSTFYDYVCWFLLIPERKVWANIESWPVLKIKVVILLYVHKCLFLHKVYVYII